METNHDWKAPEPESDPHDGEAHGVLEATRRPLLLALFGGLNAAASVLAVVFLAGGVVRKDQGMFAFGAAFVAGALVAAAAPRWLWRGGFVRARLAILGLFLVLGIVLAGRGIWAIARVVWSRVAPPAPDATSGAVSAAAGRAKDVLLVTLVEGAAGPGEADAAPSPGSVPGAYAVPAFFPSSPRREPCLASVLTGLEVIEHRVLADGVPAGAQAVTAAEAFLARGYATHGFGRSGMPAWSLRGVQEDALEPSAMDPLDSALALLARPSAVPRFVHVHREGPGLLRSVRASMDAPQGTEVAVVSLPSAEGRHPLSQLWWRRPEADQAGSGHAGAAQIGAAPVSSVSILPTLLARAGVSPLGGAVDGPVLFSGEDRSQWPAVTFAHGKVGFVHEMTAHVGPWRVDLTLTPLGRDPFDDWLIDPPFARNLVYGNRVLAQHRGTGGAPDADTLAGLMPLLVDWRGRNGRFERRR